MAALGLVLCAACFAPVERDGVIGCAESDGACPPGFQCFSVDRLCYRELPDGSDAGADDAGAVDGGAVDGGELDADPGAPDATVFVPECADGVDNDCDGAIDFPDDPGCASATDPNELGLAKCDDGIDNDDDGATDYKFGAGCGAGDPQCSGPSDSKENI